MNQNPPRLIDDPALRPLLEPEVKHSFPAERLAHNRIAISKAIAGGAAAGSVLVGMKAVALLAVLAGGGVWLALGDREPELPVLQAPPPEPAPILDPPLEPPPKPIVRKKSRAKAPPPPREERPPPPSELELQLSRLRAAREAFERGAYEDALRGVEDFPESAVSLDAALLRIDVLIALQRRTPAIDAIEQVLPRVSGPKKAALLRLQGDLRLAGGDCDGAKASYRRTLALDPNGPEAEAARRGLGQCLAR